MKLFPEHKIIDYLLANHVPELLSQYTLKVHSTSPEGLLEHCQSLFQFLEMDKASQKYKPQALAFQALYEKFELYYKNPSPNPEDKDYRFDFMEVEQVLYLITESSATQDISSYLSILEEISDNDKLLVLIQLLYRKYDDWVDGYSEGYVKWMHFLAPYMSYLVNMKFDFHMVTKLDQPEVKETITKTFQDLKAQLEKRKIEVPLQKIELSDPSRSVAELMKLKNAFQGSISPQDNQFYFELGQWSFLVHLLSCSNEVKATFLDICLSIVPYFDLAVKLCDAPETKGVVKSLENVKNIETDKTWKQDFVEGLFSDFSEKKNVHTFACLFSSILTKKDIDPALFLGKDSESLLIRLFSTVIAHRVELENLKNLHYGTFVNHYEYFIWMLLSLLESVKNKSSEHTKDCLLFIQTILKESRLRLFIRVKAYSILTLLAKDDPNLSKSIIANWNLSDTPLKNLISEHCPQDGLDLALNLRHTLNFFNKADHELIKTNINHRDFIDITQSYLARITGELTTPEDTTSLKHIGIFLLELFSLKVSKIRKTKVKFVSSLLDFLVLKCQLDIWDLFSIEHSLFRVIGSSRIFKPVISDKAMIELFKISETQTQTSQCRVSTLEPKSQLLRDKEVKNHIFNMLVSSMKKNQEALDTLWKNFEWDKRDSPEESQKLVEISHQYKRFIYFTLEWFECLVGVLKSSKFLDDNDKLKVLMESIAFFYLHPSLSVLIEGGDHEIIQARLRAIFKVSKHVDLRGFNGFYKVLAERIALINSEVLSKQNLQKALLKDLNLIMSRETLRSASELHSAYSECALKKSVEVHILVKSLNNLKHVFPSEFAYRHLLRKEKKELLANFEAVLVALSTFISQSVTLFNQENQDPSHYSSKPLPLGEKLEDACKNVMKPFLVKERGDEPKLAFFGSLVKNAFPGSAEYSSEVLVEITMDLINILDPTVKTKALSIVLCQPKIWSVFLRRISEALKQRIEPKSSGSLYSSISSLTALFTTKDDIKNVKSTLEAFKFEISPDQFMTQLLQALSEELEKFPFELIFCRNNDAKSSQTKTIISSILQLLENVYVDLKESITPEMQEKFLGKLDLYILLDPLKNLKTHIPEKLASANKTAFDNLSNFLHNYTLQIIEINNVNLPEELQGVKHKEIIRDRAFLEIEATRNSSVNKLLTLENYLKPMLDIPNQSEIEVVFEESLLWLLFYSTSVLLNQLLSSTEEQKASLKEEIVRKPDVALKINCLTEQLLKLFCTYFTTKYLKEKLSKAEPRFLYDWFMLIINTQEYLHRNFGADVLTFEGSSFTNLMGLAQIILYQEPDLALANDCEMIQKLFSLETKEGWKFSTVNVIVYVLDILFENYLPSELIIENRLKQHLMGSPDDLAPYSLSNIANDPVFKEYEKKHMKTIVSTLLEKFKISSSGAQEAGAAGNFSENNITFSLDLSRENNRAPNLVVQEVLQNLSVYAHSVMDVLIKALFNNYLHNLSQLSGIKEKEKAKFRDTTNIAILISTLATKYPHLLVLLAFKKYDFRTLVKQYVSASPLLKDLDAETLQSVTALDCLFKIKYFIYNTHDFVLLLIPAMVYTGLTYINPEEPESVVDISRLILNQSIQNITKQVEITNTRAVSGSAVEQMEAYMILHAAVVSFGFIVNNIPQKDLKDKFGRHTRKALQELLDQTLCALKILPKGLYEPLKKFGDIELLLAKNIQHYYKIQLNITSLNKETINQLKEESYKELLFTTGNESSTKASYTFESLQIEIDPSKSSANPHPTIEANLKIDKALKILNKDPSVSIILPVTKNSSVCGSEGWSNILNRAIENIGNIGTLYSNLAAAKQENAEADHHQSAVNTLKNLGFYLEATKFDLHQKEEISPVSPNFLDLKGVALFDVHSCLQSKSSPVKEKFITTLSKLLFNPNFDELSKEEKVPVSEQEVNQELQPVCSDAPIKEIKDENIPRIRFFIDPNIEQQSDFDMVLSRMMIELKIISEQISLAIANSEFQREALEDFKKKLVNTEISNKINILSIFEGHLLLCLISKFEVLRPFEYPSDIQEIREELRWIEANFVLYLSILSNMAKPNSPKKEPAHLIVADPDYQHLLFPEDFRFCTDYYEPVAQLPQNESSKEKISPPANSYMIKEMFSVSDTAVESVIGLLYIDYGRELSKANPNPLELITELCNSPTFEAKFIDFCLFFLYSPAHLEIMSNLALSFPYLTLFNTQNNSKEFTVLYNTVASNIMDILGNLLPAREYLLYQPRAYLDQYGLKKLLDLKQVTFDLHTTRMVSICDLLVGLLEFEAFSQQAHLLKKLEALLQKVFSKPRQFDILKVKAARKEIEQIRVFTRNSCEILLRMNNINPLLMNITNIIIHDFESLISRIEKLLEILPEAIEKTKQNLKGKIKPGCRAFSAKDIEPIFDYETVLVALKEDLSLASFLFTEWDSDRLQNVTRKEQEKEKLYTEALQNLTNRILKEPEVERFFISMFELADLLADKHVARIPRATSIAGYITKICLKFYILNCVKPKAHGIPVLHKLASSEPLEEILELPQFTSTFSNIIDFNLDLLIANMCRTYKNNILEVLGEEKNNKEAMHEIALICRKLPWLLDFETKKTMLMEEIENDLEERGAGSRRSITIKRKDLVKSIFDEFSNKSTNQLKRRIQVTFSGEAGYDAGGPRKEFITIAAKQLFDPERGLFQLCGNMKGIQPNPAAKMIPSHLKYFEMAGIILAKAIQEDFVVDVDFTKPFLKHILNRQIHVNDLEDLDPYLVKNLKWILENPAKELHYAFTYDVEVFGKKITKELVPGGEHIDLTEENKAEFVERMCEAKMKDEIKEETDAFLKGFSLLIPREFLGLFSPSELQLLISGESEIDVDELKKHATYSGYDSNSNIIMWLWEILAEFSQKELSAFVFFTTGSVKLSAEWFKKSPIKYTRINYGVNSLPIARTCFSEIQIPPYDAKDIFRQKLLMAIFEGQGGFLMA